MSQEQAFLEAIRRRPGSNADRLVYADWLMERGDPRGEFIQCQVQARRLAKDSPRRLDLEAKAHDLLLAHEEEWLGPMLGVIGNWGWSRGLLGWVTVAADVFLAHAERWLPALPLLGVHLRKARPHIAALASCPQLAHLNGLYLGHNDLTDDDLDVLLRSPYLKRIRDLHLQNNELREEAGRILGQSPNLPALHNLSLGHNHLDDRGVAFLTASPYLGRLRVLGLAVTGLTAEGVRTLAGSTLLSRLRVLWIGLNDLPPGCLALLSSVPAFANLRCLVYGMNRPDDADVSALAGSPHATRLRHLALEGFPAISDAGLSALASGPALGHLRSLILGSGSWGPEGMRALGHSRTLTALRTLQITADNERGPVIAEALLGQPLVRRLRCLSLRTYRVGESGLAALTAHTRRLRLRKLRLPETPNLLAVLENLLSRRLLSALVAFDVDHPPPGTVKALLEPGRLPRLRKLGLGAIPDLDEFQALLDSPLLAQLHELEIGLSYDTPEQEGAEVLRRLCAAWNKPALRRLSLHWSISADQVRLLAEAVPPPALTEMAVGASRMRAEGMATLAGSPLLRRLRRLEFHLSSSQDVPGLEALAESPQVGPLLRVDIHNGHVPREAIPALRRRFGIRFAVGARMLPQMVTMDSWNRWFGDGED